MAIDMGANAVRLRVFHAAAVYLAHIFYLLLLSLSFAHSIPLSLSLSLSLYLFLPLMEVQCT